MQVIGGCPGHSTFMPRTCLPVSCFAVGLPYFLLYGTPGLRACSLSREGIERTFTSPQAVTTPHGFRTAGSRKRLPATSQGRRRQAWKRGGVWCRPAGQTRAGRNVRNCPVRTCRPGLNGGILGHQLRFRLCGWVMGVERMSPGIDVKAGNVAGERPSRVFDVVLRGYDRQQVDEHIEQLEDQAHRHRDQAQALRRELSAVHRQLRERERPTYAGRGLRIEQLLRLAEEQATEILGEARAAADELRAAAKAGAAELRAAAENEAAELRASAERDTGDLRASAEREADTVKVTARQEADELTSTTGREAVKVRATADHQVAEERAAAEQDVAELRTITEREVAQLKATAMRERDEILTAPRRQADEMRRQVQQILEDSEAQRARAEAGLETRLASRREEAVRREAERLAVARAATQALVIEAEQRAIPAEQRAAKATAQAEQALREADQRS